MADDFTCCGRCKNELQNVQLYLHFDKHDEKQFFQQFILCNAGNVSFTLC